MVQVCYYVLGGQSGATAPDYLRHSPSLRTSMSIYPQKDYTTRVEAGFDALRKAQLRRRTDAEVERIKRMVTPRALEIEKEEMEQKWNAAFTVVDTNTPGGLFADVKTAEDVLVFTNARYWVAVETLHRLEKIDRWKARQAFIWVGIGGLLVGVVAAVVSILQLLKP